MHCAAKARRQPSESFPTAPTAVSQTWEKTANGKNGEWRMEKDGEWRIANGE
jgi:hypothetical protein